MVPPPGASRGHQRPHENPDYLPGIALTPALTATADPAAALADADRVVLAVPAQTLRANLASWTGLLPPAALLVSLMKGIELGTCERMSEVIGQVAGAAPDRIAVVSGPNLAREIAARQFAAAVVACADEGAPASSRRPATPGTSARTPTPMSSAASWAARSRT